MSIRHLVLDKAYIKSRTIPLCFMQTDVQNTFKRKCTFWNNVRFQKNVQNPLKPFIYKGYRDFKIMYVKFWFLDSKKRLQCKRFRYSFFLIMVDELYCAHYIVCNSFEIILQMKLNVKPFLNIIIVYYWGKINIFFNNTLNYLFVGKQCICAGGFLGCH